MPTQRKAPRNMPTQRKAPRNMPTQRKVPRNMPTQRKAPRNMPTQKAPRARTLGSAISQLIIQTIAASNDRSGMALPTLKKVLAATGYNVKKNQDRVRVAVKSLVKEGVLVQTRGFGASAAYKINDTGVRLPSKRRTSRTARPKAKRGVGRKAPRNMPTQRKAPQNMPTQRKAPRNLPTQRKAPRARTLGSAISQLIVQTIAASNDRSGMALPTLKKVLAATGYNVKKNQDRVRVAIKSLVKEGVLVQTRGFGASAAYKVNDTGMRLPSKRRTSRTADQTKDSRPKKSDKKTRARRAPAKSAARRRSRKTASKTNYIIP
uniref:H15 domain-containing protein n=1 Tax=Tetraodon nigroviridis TaxID=99883 RepID=H3CB45_TETNG